MIKHMNPSGFAKAYLEVCKTVAEEQYEGFRAFTPVKLNELKDTLLRDDGRELISRLNLLKEMPGSSFACKDVKYTNHSTIPAVEITTTVRRHDKTQPLQIWIENDQCSVGYGRSMHSDNPKYRTDYLVSIPRDPEGAWIDEVLAGVMRETIKEGYSPNYAEHIPMLNQS